MRAYICGTPKQHCLGNECVLSSHMRKSPQPKVHATSEEAFKCHARYLVNVMGYERRGNREFSPPDGSEIVILTKKCRFGGELRGGKRSEKSSKGSRLMPRQFVGGMLSSY